ncbi:NADP-dependent oxidoreductase [Mesorhizobium sp. NPDC059054]|uniref:NADP-dependent oxidoreductase n=1 Tax=Mesorhizobium sp. NPDC059054 TaxID=3346711 RepID=UPI0036C47CD3
MSINHQLCLRRRPVGMVCADDFFVIGTAIPKLEEGQFLVRNEYISLDPAMRGWVDGKNSYFPPVELGSVMRGITVGRVEQSRHPSYSEGDYVTGMLNVQQYAISNGFQIRAIQPDLVPPPSWLGGLGIPGVTAYYGLKEIGRPKPGETLLVSAAAGAVGSMVGQIGKILGCRVIGVAGSVTKCEYLINNLGFDGAINYRAGPINERLFDTCPNKIDVYFDNVGGRIFDSVLPHMNLYGRIPLCGMISHRYEADQAGFENFRFLLTSRLKIEGFIVSDYVKKLLQTVDILLGWHLEGKLSFKEDIREGDLMHFPLLLNDLFEGKNFGKLIMKI